MKETLDRKFSNISTKEKTKAAIKPPLKPKALPSTIKESISRNMTSFHKRTQSKPVQSLSTSLSQISLKSSKEKEKPKVVSHTRQKTLGEQIKSHLTLS